MSPPNFNGIDPWFDPFLIVWGLWGYWKKEAGFAKRPLFLAITLLAVLALGIRLFETGTLGYATVIALRWLLMIMVVLALLSMRKYERHSN